MVMDPVMQHIIASGMAILFMSAGVQKFLHSGEFEGALRAYELAPANMNRFLARSVPFLEAATGTALLVVETQPAAIFLACCLLGSYALAMTINLWRGRHAIDCGCQLGGGGQSISWNLVLRNLALVLVTLSLLLPAINRSLNWLDYIVVTFGVVVSCLLYGICNSLINTHARGASL